MKLVGVQRGLLSVYLPQGNWYDFFSNIRYSGGQTIIWTNANQSQMPLFVREGAVLN